MYCKAVVFVEAFEFAFNALDRTLEGMDEAEYRYKLTEESNSIRSILNHLSKITNINMMQIIKGDFTYSPENWEKDYQQKDHSIERARHDIRVGREKVLDGLAGLTEAQLEEVLELMSGPYPRKIGLYAYLGELFHHRGQIAFIRGSIRRLREHDRFPIAQ